MDQKCGILPELRNIVQARCMQPHWLIERKAGNCISNNVYNAPAGSNNGGEAVRALLNLTFPGHSSRVFVARDLNLRHTRWQASSQTTSPLAEPFIEWTDRLNITLISESDTTNHTHGSVLDLAFASNPLILAGAESSIIPELDVTSDHLPIASLVR